MKPPIIVNNFGDILVFDSVQEAERYLEPVDVANGEYVAYDSAGTFLELTVTEINRTVIQPAELTPSHEVELEQALRRFFTNVGISPEWLSTATLPDLIGRSLDYKTK
jgi:hypothetical protein